MLRSSGPVTSATIGPRCGQRPLLRARLRAGAPLSDVDQRSDIAVALCVPLSGSVGIFGPSAMASARLAVAELNRESGIVGRGCRLLTVNASDDAQDLEQTLMELVEAGKIDALIGMHTSAVRHRIVAAVGGHIPVVYTPLYEGGETTPGVFAIGEVTARQLQPALRWLGLHRRPRRWLAVGNDYVWPHVAHRQARKFIAESRGDMVAETYVPLGTSDFSEVLEQIRSCRADAVLISLIGQDAVDFNRAFGRTGLSKSVLRLSCAIGENELLGIGADNADELYVSSGYFASLDTDANLAFKERYRDHFGERAPVLNTFGQSTYEGVHFLAALLAQAERSPDHWAHAGSSPVAYRSARDAHYGGDGVSHTPIYLAQAEGNTFRVITKF
jgi:urea transport system substrate-binding protein